jgi:hypothetical protein
VIVIVFSATEMLPARDCSLVLWLTLKLTVPSPLPLPAPVRVIQLKLVVANQVQPSGAVMVVEPEPPPDGKLIDLGEMLKMHTPAPVWSTVNVSPAMVIVPVREDELLFSLTE